MRALLVAVLLATAGCDQFGGKALTVDEWKAARKVCTDQELYPRERTKWGLEVVGIECRTPQGGVVKTESENPE